MKQYRGKLSSKQAADGMNAALRNARRLLEDSKLLFEAKRYASAASLAILSVEESGKSPILRSLARNEDEAALKLKWSQFRNHRAKNIMWQLPQLARNGRRTFAELASLFDPKSDHSKVLDEVKQVGFYTDCLGENVNWSEPTEIITEELARGLIETAEIMGGDKEQVSEREIELWVEHMGTNLESSNTDDLRKFYKALVKEGLAKVTMEQVEKFLGEDKSG